MAVIAAFPTPDTTGIPYSRYWKPRADYDQVTYSQKFEDASEAANAVNSTAPQRWVIEFDGLSPFEAEIWQDHYDLAFADLNSFPYTEKDGTTVTGVKYLKFECSHDGHKSWIKKVSVELIKRPA